MSDINVRYVADRKYQESCGSAAPSVAPYAHTACDSMLQSSRETSAIIRWLLLRYCETP